MDFGNLPILQSIADLKTQKNIENKNTGIDYIIEVIRQPYDQLQELKYSNIKPVTVKEV